MPVRESPPEERVPGRRGYLCVCRARTNLTQLLMPGRRCVIMPGRSTKDGFGSLRGVLPLAGNSTDTGLTQLESVDR